MAGACEYSEDAETGVKTMKVGGRGANGLKPYIVRFVHSDGEKILRVTLVGTPEAGFVLTFAADKETVIDAEFKAVSHDDAGTLVIVSESTVTQ